MSRPARICFVLGTRPEVIKCWPVIRLLRGRPDFEVSVVLTGQHRHLLDQAVRLLKVPVDVDLDVMQPDQSLEELTAALCHRLSGALRELSPDCVLVQGDTSSVFLAALSAFYLDVPVGHIEAGLRSGDVRHPFPEEMNRRLTAQLARLHFAPTAAARAALLREGVAAERIDVTGNTGIDALRLIREDLDAYPVDAGLNAALAAAAASSPSPRIIAVTVHRRENRASMTGIAEALRTIVQRHDDVSVVFPVHPGPAVRAAFLPKLAEMSRCHLIEPLDYANFVRLLTRCHFVLTDSGGVQEEAPYLGKPVLVMRRTTERPEAAAAGAARLIGEQPGEIVEAARNLLTDGAAYQHMARPVSPYGDGHASERIADRLRREFNGPAADGGPEAERRDAAVAMSGH